MAGIKLSQTAIQSLTVLPTGPYVSASAPGSIMNEYWLPPPTGADDSANINAVIVAALTGGVPATVKAMPGKTYIIKSAAIAINGGPLVFDFRGAVLKLDAAPAFTLTVQGATAVPVMYVLGSDVQIIGGTIDGVSYTAFNRGCGIIVGTNAARVSHESIRCINLNFWPFWCPQNAGGVTGYATDVTYFRCRAANSGNQSGSPDGGGFKCEAIKVSYERCVVESAVGCFGWDLAPPIGFTAGDDVTLLDCDVTMAASVTNGIGVFIEDTAQNDIRIMGGQFQVYARAFQIYGGPGSRFALIGCTTKAATAGVGTGILINQGTSTGGRIRCIGCEGLNWQVGMQAACFLGQGGGSVGDIQFLGNDCQTCTTGISLFNNAAGPSTLSNISVIGNDVSGCTTPIQAFQVNANSGGQGIVVRNNMGFNPETVQAVAFAASFTPNPATGATIAIGALTATITINAVAAPIIGETLTLVFLQDGSGGRTVSWNGAYKTAWQPASAINAISSISFVFDGTSWQQTAIGLVDQNNLYGTIKSNGIFTGALGGNNAIWNADTSTGIHSWKVNNSSQVMQVDQYGHFTVGIAGTPATSNLGANITSVTFTGTDRRGKIVIVASGALAANTRIATCAYANAFLAAPFPLLVNQTSGVGLVLVNFYSGAEATGSFDLFSDFALAAGTYTIRYLNEY